MDLKLAEIESPIGTLLLVAETNALCALEFADRREGMMRSLVSRYGPVRLRRSDGLDAQAGRVRAYLTGQLDALDALAVDPGGTPFQQRVWSALRRVPAGATVTYGALAASIGSPTAARAVGAASGRNPVSLIVPCHRVVGSDGSLTGYGGGVDRKRWLLRHEGAGV